MSAPTANPRDEVVSICQDLIRIPSVNYGEGVGDERDAAEYVAASLAEVGIESELIESAPRRTSVVARIEGSDPSRPGLVLHGHLDVVPADAKDWQFDPFSAEIHEGMIWGRGAVDMKNMDAMMLSVIRSWTVTGYKPPRDIVLTFFADEEAGGLFGSHYLVDKRPDLFEGCTDAVSEVGGFSITLPNDKRIYMIQAAEKGIQWLKLIAEGTASHGSLVSTDNAVVHLANAVAAIGTYNWPVRETRTVRAMMTRVAEALGVEYDPENPQAIVSAMGTAGVAAASTLRNTANPSMLEAGYKANVVPGHASAVVDCRYLPGFEDEQLQTIQDLIGSKVRAERMIFDRALEVDFEGPMIEAMLAAIAAADPDGIPVPYALSGGTDNKAMAKLGINGYGFAPMKLPPELPFWHLFHGVDERVPLDSLIWGTSVLDDFLRRV